jgi:PAS domain S-box-containing protein
MSGSDNQEHYKNKIRDLELQLSQMKFELEDVRFNYKSESEKHLYYQLIADFTFGWELWFEPNGKIKYCSPSCNDLTGFTSNQIINSSGILELLVYEDDKEKYIDFFDGALSQELVNHSLEFRILTRTKQLCWCMMSVRGVYDKKGKYLGIRASVQDITRLKRAMGHIHELEKGKEFELRTKQRLQTELELKDRELVSFLLQLSQKNELLNKASKLLDSVRSSDSKKLKATVNQLHVLLKSGIINQLDWSMVESQIEKSHPGFLGRLQVKHPTISEKDKKLCSYIRLGLSSKEISGLMNITPQSVEIARVRLRKKLAISSKIRLSKYLSFV